MAGSGYDYDVNTLSPEGKVHQVEYANKATETTGTIIGIICKDGLLLGAEKTVVSELSIAGTDHRIYSINKHIGMVVTGLIPDGRALVWSARSESNSYYEFHGIPIPGKVLADRVAAVIHQHTMQSWYRPYGVVVIIASHDEFNGSALHMIDASGQCYGYFGCAAGKERQMARNEIEKLSPKDHSCKEAAFELAKICLLYTSPSPRD
eukprot:TRINITY_DN1556_c0_g1_i8.p1 TRINITY_DN1556_c0_g1~~TRINITY_DN1556_c0_g1_i8.p1  ORF type:complete len:207 (-),score=60.49 TRINITY_DN1556_c0_g1_i8:53-673(-)